MKYQVSIYYGACGVSIKILASNDMRYAGLPEIAAAQSGELRPNYPEQSVPAYGHRRAYFGENGNHLQAEAMI